MDSKLELIEKTISHKGFFKAGFSAIQIAEDSHEPYRASHERETAMKRQYFIADNLESIKQLENILLANYFEYEQLHVFNWNDKLVNKSRFNYREINDCQKRNMWRSGLRGLVIGLTTAAILLTIVYSLGLYTNPAGWIPFVFLAIVAIGFFAWEGGIHGIQKQDEVCSRFMEALRNGQVVFFVDFTRNQEEILNEAINAQRELVATKDSAAPPDWMVNGQVKLKKNRSTTLRNDTA